MLPVGFCMCMSPNYIYFLDVSRFLEALTRIQRSLLFITWRRQISFHCIRCLFFMEILILSYFLSLALSLLYICQQNSSEELYSLFEHFYDHFHANPQKSSHGKFISSHSNDAHALDQLRIIKNKANSSTQVNDKAWSTVHFFH